ncbi:MAG TPA: S8 family serine peptidase [Thermoanaerobaculia bacterium]|nr:S8 family serine peptidase [Thermoanaerobaculia bacterium]
MRRTALAAFLLAVAVPFAAFAGETSRYLVATQRPLHGAIRELLLHDAIEARDTVELTSFSGFAADLTAEEAATLQQSPEVRWVEPVIERHALGTTALVPQSTPYGIDMMHVASVWPSARGNAINVVVIDTGVDYRHPELAAIYAGGHNFITATTPNDPLDDNGHGTHVSGIIAAANNDFGVVGVAPNVRLWAAKVLDEGGSGTNEKTIQAVDWVRAQKKAQGGLWVVNLSLGATRSSPAEREAFDKLAADGILAFAASGNESVEGRPAPLSFPAGYSSVTSVGAVDSDRGIAVFSNQGAELDLVAPGVSVLSTMRLGAGSLATVRSGDKIALGAALTGSTNGTVSGDYVYCGIGKPENFPASVKGKIALIQRGELKFAEKVMNAVAAGATAVAIFNNVDDKTISWTLYDTDNPATLQYNWPLVIGMTRADGAPLAAKNSGTLTLANEADDYAILSGTSMASPYATGAAALIWSLAPYATPDAVRTALTSTAVDLGANGRDNVYGAGLVDALAAAKQLNPSLIVPSPHSTTGRTILKRGH